MLSSQYGYSILLEMMQRICETSTQYEEDFANSCHPLVVLKKSSRSVRGSNLIQDHGPEYSICTTRRTDEGHSTHRRVSVADN